MNNPNNGFNRYVNERPRLAVALVILFCIVFAVFTFQILRLQGQTINQSDNLRKDAIENQRKMEEIGKQARDANP